MRYLALESERRISASVSWSITGSDKGFSQYWHQAIILTNAELLLITPCGTNFSEISIEIPTFSFTKMSLKMLFGEWRPFCLVCYVEMC